MPIDGELTPPDDSLRGDLEAAFSDTGGVDGAQASSGSNDAGDAGASAVVDQVSSAASKEAPATDDGRQRGPDGKFIQKEAAPEKVAAATESPSTDTTKASEVAAQPAASAPPAGWTAAEKAEWAKLPPAIQGAVSRRELEMSNGGRQWSEEKRRYESVLSPVAEAARRNGLTTEQGLQSLVRAQDFLERDAPGAIKWLAQQHGINLATLAGPAPAEGSSATQQQPDITQLVRQAVQPLIAPIQQRWQAEERNQQNTMLQAVHSFAASPGHEHYNAVEGTIALILPQVIEENPSWSNEQKLQEAYDRALYATPATRQAVLAAKESAAEETRRSEASVRATRARGAAVSVTGSPQGTAASEAAPSLREEILRAMTG